MPRLLVIGPPRSGTLFTAHLLRHAGLEIGHEISSEAPHIRADGAVGWVYAVDREYVMANGHAKGSVAGLTFDHVWHQVRHPLNTIASIAALGQRVFDFAGYADASLPSCMRFWCDWNERCAKKASWRFRIEDLTPGHDTWRHMCEVLGLSADQFPEVSRKTNTIAHAGVTWNDLSAADEATASRVRQLATEYGY